MSYCSEWAASVFSYVEINEGSVQASTSSTASDCDDVLCCFLKIIFKNSDYKF